ncbi:MAG: CotH kinase family protein [Eubacteriales bacterium]|nr:CotH kinase family protein [Eubacteriales bacterium]
MITSKYIDRIVAVVLALALSFCGGAYYLGTQETASASSPGSGKTTMPYETSVFNKQEVTEVEISVDEDTWAELLENATLEEYVQCNITVNGIETRNVGIRCKGNTSLSQVASSDSDRYSFKVKFDEYVSGQTLDGLDKLVLNNIFCDNTYMKEYLSYDLMSYLGVAAPLYSFAHITVNGEEWGLYLAIEALEKSFARRMYGDSYGALYKVESTDMGGMMQPGDGKEDGGNRRTPGGERPEGMELPEAGEMSEGAQMPEGKEIPEAGEVLEGKEMPGIGEMPDGMELPEMGGMPDDGEFPAGGKMPDGAGMGFGKGGGMWGSSGTDLVYTDDEEESYSGILENAAYKVTDQQKESLIEAIKGLNEGEDLEEYVNTDQTLRYFAANTFLVNQDDYLSNLQHNIYLYEEDGVISPVPWDYNLAFGGFQSRDASVAVNLPIDTPVSEETLEQRPLLGKLLEQDEYKQLYHEYLQEIVSGYFENGTFENTVDYLNTLIKDYVKNDATAFCTYEEYQTAIENLKLFGQYRELSVQGQLNGTIPSTEDGQKEDSSALIDAAGVDLTAMGIQGGR